jgi:hypothetical protein
MMTTRALFLILSLFVALGPGRGHADVFPTRAKLVGELYGMALAWPDAILAFITIRKQPLNHYPDTARCMEQIAAALRGGALKTNPSEAWDRTTRQWSSSLPPDFADTMPPELAASASALTVARFLDDIRRALPELRAGRDQEFKQTNVYRENVGRSRLRDFFADKLKAETAMTPQQKAFAREMHKFFTGKYPGTRPQSTMSFDPESMRNMEFQFHSLTVRDLASTYCQ